MVVNIIGLSTKNGEGEQGENGGPPRAGDVAEEVSEYEPDGYEHYRTLTKLGRFRCIMQ